MNEDLAVIVDKLRSELLVDHGALLKPGGRRQLETMLAAYDVHGRTARILLLPRGENLENGRAVWDELGLDDRQHLLLLFNGERWEARGWGLSPQAVETALQKAVPDLRRYYAAGLIAALHYLGEAASIDLREGGLTVPLTGGALILLTGAGAVGFILRRRMKIEAETQQEERFEELQNALASAREIYAEVILRGDEIGLLNPDQAQKLQLRAADLGDRLDDLERQAEERSGRPEALLGRAEQLENELRAAHSAFLQERHLQSQQLQSE